MNISYISGFFDADGYLTLIKGNKNEIAKSPILGFTNTYKPLLMEIKGYFDNLNIKSSTSIKNPINSNHSVGYDLRYRGNAAIKVAKLLTSIHKKKSHRLNLLLTDYKKVVKRNGKYNSDQLKELLEFESKFFSVS